MCLHAIKSEKPGPEGEGYKVFTVRSGGPGIWNPNLPITIELRSLYFPFSEPAYTEGVWNKADIKGEIGDGNFKYHKGFHIFLTAEAATRMTIDILVRDRVMLKILYRGAHTLGMQWPESKEPDSVVAEEFMIVPGQKLYATAVQGV